VPVAVFTSACGLIAAACATTARETHQMGMAELGNRGPGLPALTTSRELVGEAAAR
jgi:hypothetical protein